ncbi:MAG: DUF2089 domain-containing protein [Anaerolineales bacterium]|nr:DUF2089 domain-containing protein [Anaerolineales bacterium]
MQPIPNRCPLCGGELTVTRIYCRDCDTAYEGRFSSGLFSNLTQEQLNFMVTFVRCEGKITRVGEEIGLSYPTIRNRLHEVIRALGYEPGGDDEPAGLTDQERQRILEDLDSGAISAEEAMRLLRETEA